MFQVASLVFQALQALLAGQNRLTQKIYMPGQFGNLTFN